MRWNYLFIIAFFFITGIFAVLSVRYFQVKRIEKKPFVPEIMAITITPPADSQKGELSDISGDVKVQSFYKDSFFQATASAKIVQQGDTVLNGSRASALVSFTNYADLKLGSNAEIVFSGLMPGQFLIWQKGGTVIYTTIGNEKLSIRSLNALVSLEGGIKIVTDSYYGTVSLAMTDGTATIGFEDKDNNAQVYKLSAKEKAVYDDASRTVEMR